jgi:hypothetical protein
MFLESASTSFLTSVVVHATFELTEIGTTVVRLESLVLCLLIEDESF